MSWRKNVVCFSRRNGLGFLRGYRGPCVWIPLHRDLNRHFDMHAGRSDHSADAKIDIKRVDPRDKARIKCRHKDFASFGQCNRDEYLSCIVGFPVV